jgi:hypothetical protein
MRSQSFAARGGVSRRAKICTWCKSAVVIRLGAFSYLFDHNQDVFTGRFDRDRGFFEGACRRRHKNWDWLQWRRHARSREVICPRWKHRDNVTIVDILDRKT